MSFISELVDHIAANTSLVVDTDLFLGGYVVDSPVGSVCVLESAPGFEKESGIIVHPVQVLCKHRDYVSTQTQILVVHNVLKNKSGFSGVSNVFYSEVIGYPSFVSRLDDGSFVFSATYTIRRR